MAPPADGLGELLRAAQSGDTAALGLLYDALQPSLLRYLSWQEPSVAEDLAADAWVAVAERLPGFEGDGPAFRGWLFAIARRRLSDHRRRAQRRRTAPVPTEVLSELAGREDPESQVVGDLAGDATIARLTELLPPAQAEVVVLRVVAGLSVEEAARVMDKRPGNIRVLQHRALRSLARGLAEETRVQA